VELGCAEFSRDKGFGVFFYDAIEAVWHLAEIEALVCFFKRTTSYFFILIYIKNTA
jgi:hypothetical protein